LLHALGLNTFKIPSGEITNLPYLRKIGSLRKKVILSTGMADLREIGAALRILLAAGTKRDQITILHCVTEYPAPFQEINLRAMQLIRNKFRIPVGYSDHTLGLAVPIAAVALGAVVIEKHLTLNKKMSGPDHLSSLDPKEFASMVQGIRAVELALGSMTKNPAPAEITNRRTVRKSIVAARDIKKGEIFTTANITAKRPGTGLSPMLWDKVIGQAAVRDFSKDELITYD
jgi:N,N'-diacetyllegionaminate synthase